MKDIMHSLPQQPPELRYTVEWRRFQEPLRESLLRPKFMQLSKEDPETSAFIESVRAIREVFGFALTLRLNLIPHSVIPMSV